MKKFVSLLASFSILFNSLLTPLTVIAQEVTPVPTPVPTEEPITSPDPTEQPTSEPTFEPTTEPTIEPTSEPTPTEIGTPEATPTEPGQAVEATEESITPASPEASLGGEVQGATNENATTNAPPTVTSDKEDYHPGETAVLTGNFFEAVSNFVVRIFGGNVGDTNYKEESFNVTTDSLGSFVLNYVLDNIFRPFYRVNVFNSQGDLVAETSFTDSPICQNDVEGANDEPGQKDLTKMCHDDTTSPGNVLTSWNWDDISWSGNNTGDACNLFDTDNDGKVNYAVCVTIGGDTAAIQSTTIYSCGDGKADRCTQPANAIAPPYSSSCSVSPSTDDPFPAGSNYPNDTKGSCSVSLTDVGNASGAKLIDVCSYPSQQPNSDPSDCIIATSLQTGKLEVIKQLSPTNDSGLFDLSINGSVLATGVGNGGTTGEQVVLAGDRTFGEAGNGGTDLSNYTISVSCTDGNSSVSTTGTNPWTVNIGNNKDVVCTITNTRVNNASLTVVKNAVPDDERDFAFTTTGTGLSNFSLDDDADNTLQNTVSFSNLAAGTYSVTETPVAGWDLTSATCTDGSLVSAINLSQGENVTCTFTNTKRGKILVNKETTPDGDSQVFGFVANYDQDGFNLSDGGQNDSGFLPEGVYSVSENIPSGWTLSSATCSDQSSVNAINLSAGETVTCTFNNTKLGKIIVEKQTLPDGSTESFEFQTDYGPNFELKDGEQNDSGYLEPALGYSVTETAESGWDLDSATCSDGSDPANIDLSAGETITCTFTNSQRASISGVKLEDLDGTTVTSNDQTNVLGWTIELYECASDFTGCILSATDVTDGSGYSFTNLVSGYYQVREVLQNGWTNLTNLFTNITLDPGEESTNNNFINFEKATIVVHKDVVNPDSGPTTDNTSFKVKLNGVDEKTLSEDTTATYTDLLPGTYTVTESVIPAGYELVSLTNNGSVTVQSGETHNVYVVNKQKVAKLTVIKHVVNDNNGSLDAEDFTMTVEGVNPSDTSFLGSETGTVIDLYAGAYSVDEQEISGYTKSLGANCSGDITWGEEKTCTVTNNDDAGTLIVRKVIVGGSKTYGDFTFVVNNDPAVAFEGDGQNDLTVDAGVYTVVEPTVEGYTTTYDNCSRVTVTNGGSQTCTITNTRDTGTIIVRKLIDADDVLGGDQTLGVGWEMDVDGFGDASDFGPQTTGADGTTTFSQAKTGQYNVREINQEGYVLLDYYCDNGVADDNIVFISLGKNETVNCTFVNFLPQPSLTAVKSREESVPDEILVGDTTTYEVVVTNTGNVTLYNPIVYDYFDTDHVDYVSSSPVDAISVTEDIGEDSGDYDNDGDTTEHIGLIVWQIPEDLSAGEDYTLTFNFIATSITPDTPDFETQATNGIYTEVCTEDSSECTEEDTLTTDFSYAGVDVDALGSVGGTKFNDANGNGEWNDNEGVLADVTIRLNGDEDSTTTDQNGEYEFTDLSAGSYTICEDVPDGYQQTYPEDCHEVTISENGDELTDLDFGNQELVFSVNIEKSNDKASGTSAGQTVTYTLEVTNTGNQTIFGLDVNDFLPGGFTYVLGTTTGDTTSDPSISGNNLTWENVGDLEDGESFVISYNVKIADEASNGVYTNFATCVGNVRSRQEVIECNVADSTVSLGSGTGYGGNLVGQVLGASIELPATGNPTWALAFALLGLSSGLYLKKKYEKS